VLGVIIPFPQWLWKMAKKYLIVCQMEVAEELKQAGYNHFPQCPTCKSEMYDKLYFACGTTVLNNRFAKTLNSPFGSIVCIWCFSNINYSK
jgi:hypothetical protein